jgi:Carboxypeptidase regulatory-like domain
LLWPNQRSTNERLACAVVWGGFAHATVSYALFSRGVFMKKVFQLAALCVLATGMALGQSQNGSVTGVITDSTGAVVAGATVTVTNVATGAVRTVTTDGAGVYDVEGLPPQEYKVSVEAKGFAVTTTQTFTIAVGSANKISAKLSVEQQSAQVEVTADSLAGINLENAENSQVINNEQLVSLPALTRNPYAFVSLSGNATSDPTGTNRGVGVALGGARSASSEILLDGLENTYLFSVGVATQVPLDAVQEYRVITSNYGPQYGRASGGVVNLITRGGTNGFHGTAWEFYRPSTFVSADSFNKANGVGQHRFVRNEFGFVIGGPIKKDKLFFFGGNEWLRVRSTNASLFVVPTSQFIGLSSANTQGFFTQYGNLNATPIGSPYQLSQLATLNSSWGGATGDVAKLEALGIAASTPMFQLVQTTSYSDAGGGVPQNTYNPMGRIDFNMTDKTQMYGRYVLYNQVTPEGTVNVSPYAGYNTSSTTKAQNLVYSITHTFNSQWTSQLELGLMRVNQNSPLGDRPAGPTMFVNSTTFKLGGNNIVFPGYSETNASNGLPSGGPQNNIMLSPVFSYTKGRHTMTFGGQYTYIRDNHTFPIYDNAQESLVSSGSAGALVNFQAGVFNFFQANIDSQGKYPCAKDLITGLQDVTSACTITTPINLPIFGRSNRYQEWATFYNDEWKATPRLTLSAGLRYELYGTQHNKNPNLDSNFYWGTSGSIQDRIRAGKILRATDTAPAGVQNPNGKLWNTNYKQFAPRLAFAYDLTGDGKTVVRGGYGISYERNFGNVTYNVALNPPGQFAISLTNVDNGGASFPISTGVVGPFSSAAGIQKALPQATVRAVNPNIKPSYMEFYTLAVERQVAPSLSLGASFQGARGIHGYSIANFNRLYYGQLFEGDAATYASPGSGANSNRLNPQYTSINVRGSDADSYYNALNISARASNLYHTGLTFTANYTFAHSTDNLTNTFASDEGSNGSDVGGVAYFDPFNKLLDHGNSDNDVKHRLALGLVYTTPFVGSNAIMRQVVGGWSFGTQYIAATGVPFTMFDSAAPAKGTSGNGITPRARFLTSVPHQRTHASTPYAGNPGYYDYLDFPARGTNNATNPNYGYYVDSKVGYADLPTVTGAGDTFVNAGSTGVMSARNAFRGPGTQTFNADLSKSFKLEERYRLEFRAELYNVLNHQNEYMDFGGTNDVNVVPFALTYKDGQRQLQLAAKFNF